MHKWSNMVSNQHFFTTKPTLLVKPHSWPKQNEDKKAKPEQDEVSAESCEKWSYPVKLWRSMIILWVFFSVSQSKFSKKSSKFFSGWSWMSSRWNLFEYQARKPLKMQLEKRWRAATDLREHSYFIFSSGDFLRGWFFRETWQHRLLKCHATLGQTKKLLKQLSKEEMGQGIDGMKHLQIRRINSWKKSCLVTWCLHHTTRSRLRICLSVALPLQIGSWNSLVHPRPFGRWRGERSRGTQGLCRIATVSHHRKNVWNLLNRRKFLPTGPGFWFLCAAVSHVR